MLAFSNVKAGYDHEEVLHGVSFECHENEITTIVGRNGCGKSTLLKCAVRQLKLMSGNVYINGSDISLLTPKTLAKEIAFLPQVRDVPSISVSSLVMHGRFPYMSFPRIPSKEDKRIVQEVMEEMKITAFSDVNAAELSGGERQRVYIAMMLAQNSNIMLFDEPITYLDIKSRFELYDIMKELKERGKTIVTVVHDIQDAMTISDRIVFMKEGNVAFCGNSIELMQSGILEESMGVSAKIAETGEYYLIRV